MPRSPVNLAPASPVSSVDADKLVEFIVLQRQRGLAPATIRRRVSAIRGFCRWLNQVGAVADDPWRGVDMRIRQPKRLPRPAHEASIRRLLASLCHSAGVSRDAVPVDPFERPYQANTLVAVALMLGTGLRVGEVVALRCEDLDPDARSARVIGKGARERQVYLSSAWIVGLIQAQLRDTAPTGHTTPVLAVQSAWRHPHDGVCSHTHVPRTQAGRYRRTHNSPHPAPHGSHPTHRLRCRHSIRADPARPCQSHNNRAVHTCCRHVTETSPCPG